MKPSKNLTVTINRQNLTVAGIFDLIDNVNNPIELHLKVDKCSTQTSKCQEYNYSKVPGICSYFVRLPFQTIGLGEYITPKMRCPLKKGVYTSNIVLLLEKFGYLPIDTSVKYQVKIMLFEVITGKKNRIIFCLNGNVRAMESSARGKSG